MLLEWTDEKNVNLSLPSLRADTFSKELMERTDSWTSPLFILFFVLSGASLNLLVFSDIVVVSIGIIYVIFRAGGKYLGAYSSAGLVNCDKPIKNYLGITLFPQAGVALGMASQALTFGGETGAAATLYVANALAAGTMIDDAGGAGMDALRNGKVSALFSGTWDAANVKDALGDNYAAAQLPCITIDGAEKQMMSFSGSKAFAVNPNSANMKAATALAAWLGSAEMQELHFDLRNGEVIPCATSLLANEKFAANPAAVAQNDTIANTSKLQPSIPEMGNYWGNAESLGKALANGEVNADNAAELTETWNNGLNGGL